MSNRDHWAPIASLSADAVRERREHDCAGAATHLHALVWAAQRACRDLPWLELGCGHYSTAVLLAATHGRTRLFRLESDPKYLGLFAGWNAEWDVRMEVKAQDQWHTLIESATREAGGRWGLVFVDQWPHAQRVLAAQQLRDRAELIVMHDSEEADIRALAATFKYRRDHTERFPFTSVLSDLVDLARL